MNPLARPSRNAAPTRPHRLAPATVRETPAPDALSEGEIDGPPELAAEKVRRVSVEGRPAEAEAKSGPRTILRLIVWTISISLVGAVLASLWFGWVAAPVALALGAAAVLFNPAIAAAFFRVGDRAEVIQQDRS